MVIPAFRATLVPGSELSPLEEGCARVHDYEVTFILNPALPDEELTAQTERVSALIANAGGDIVEIHPWGGKRRLAYPIQHHRDGYYVTTKFRTTSSAAHGLDAQIKLNDNVMRHLVIRLDLDESK